MAHPLDPRLLNDSKPFGGPAQLKVFAVMTCLETDSLQKNVDRAIYFTNPPTITDEEIHGSQSIWSSVDVRPKSTPSRIKKFGTVAELPKAEVASMKVQVSADKIAAKTAKAIDEPKDKSFKRQDPA